MVEITSRILSHQYLTINMDPLFNHIQSIVTLHYFEQLIIINIWSGDKLSTDSCIHISNQRWSCKTFPLGKKTKSQNTLTQIFQHRFSQIRPHHTNTRLVWLERVNAAVVKSVTQLSVLAHSKFKCWAPHRSYFPVKRGQKEKKKEREEERAGLWFEGLNLCSTLSYDLAHSPAKTSLYHTKGLDCPV